MSQNYEDSKEGFNDIDNEEDIIQDNDINKINNENKNNNDKEKIIRKPGEKQKRRSKIECHDRGYKCGCGKTYLSYPALYTHIKTKHDGKTPEGTNANQIQNGKGRGRPRKNFLMNEEIIIKKKREYNRIYNENQSNELKDILNQKNCSYDYFKKGEIKYDKIYYFFGLLNNKEKDRIKKLEINENNKNINNINYYIEKYNINDLFDNEMLNNISYKELYICYKDMENKNILDIEKIDKKDIITCDQSFILYLYYISKKINKDFCKINLIILKHFRDLINILGWNLLSRFKSLDDEDISKNFCTIKEPLKIPLLVNDFCNNYIKNIMKDFDIYFIFIIISHFNFWLYANNLTFIQLNLPNIFNNKNKNDNIKDNIKDDIKSDIINNNNDNKNKNNI